MRTPEQAEQFKKDYLTQIDVKSLNKIEKVLVLSEKLTHFFGQYP